MYTHNEELLKWLQTTSPDKTAIAMDAVRQRLLDDEWNEHVIEATFIKYMGSPTHVRNIQPPLAYPRPPDGFLEKGFMHLSNRETASLVVSVKLPKLWVFDNLVNKNEADSLIRDAVSKLTPSNVVDNENGGNKADSARTSSGVFYPRASHPTIALIEDRVSGLSQWSKNNFESVHVLRYLPGEEYKPHNDYFDSTAAGAESRLSRGGQRVASFIVFLSDTEQGGETVFPVVGLSVAPKTGRAVMFSYPTPDKSSKTLHGGAPVIKGEKWVAVIWMREGEFK